MRSAFQEAVATLAGAQMVSSYQVRTGPREGGGLGVCKMCCDKTVKKKVIYFSSTFLTKMPNKNAIKIDPFKRCALNPPLGKLADGEGPLFDGQK